jgi:uncharacterized membrane protein
MSVILALLVACSGTDTTPSDTTDTAVPKLSIEMGDCADGTDLTWADAEVVFSDRCTECHSTTLTGDARKGATEFIDYDTAEAAIANSFLTWSMMYSGQMPKDAGPLPDDEAWLLWEWLSCGGPE